MPREFESYGDEDEDSSADILSGEYDEIFGTAGLDEMPPGRPTAVPPVATPAQDTRLAQDVAAKLAQDMTATIVNAIKNMPPPVVHVNVEAPKKRPEKTVVTEHDAQGRIKAYERYEIDEPSTS